MAHDVFISYATPDKLIADAACALLEQRGIRVWIAPRDVVPGSDWAESIVNAIESTRVMVIVFSSHANKSTQIGREVERAAHHGIPLLPLRIEDTTPSKSLEYFISARHWLDAMTPPMERHLERLAETILRLLGDGDAKASAVGSVAAAPSGAPPLAATSPSGASSPGRNHWKSAFPAIALVAVVALLAWYQSTPKAADLPVPAPVASAPVERARVESARVESARVESAPVESAPVESAPVERATVESGPIDNAVRSNQQPVSARQALQDANAAIERAPIDPNGYIARSQAYLRLGDADQVIKDATEAIRLAPKRADGYLARSQAYLRLGDAEKAIADATMAINLAPTRADLYLARSQAYAESGEVEEVFADADKAIELDPGNPAFYTARAKFYRYMRLSAEEEADLRRAVDLDPTDSASLYRLAKALANQRKYQEAIVALETVQGMFDAAEYDDLKQLVSQYRAAMSAGKSSPPASTR